MARRQRQARPGCRRATRAAPAEPDAPVLQRAEVSAAILSVATEVPASTGEHARGNAGIFHRITSCLAVLLILIRRLPGTCVSTMKRIPLRNNVFCKALVWICVGIVSGYCVMMLPAWTLPRTDEPEAAPRGAGQGFLGRLFEDGNAKQDLRSLLAEQANQMELLKGQVLRLNADIRSVKQDVQQMREALLDEGHVQLSDWALQSSGAAIDVQRTSPTYIWAGRWLCKVFWSLCAANPPDTILQPDVTPGQCWPFQGSQGHVVIQLPARIWPAAVSVQHIYKAVSPSGTVSSAPRDFTISGMEKEGEEETLLGSFTYDVDKEAIQTFPLKKLGKAIQYVKLEVKSNWGNAEYTCIYHVQVHGKVAG